MLEKSQLAAYVPEFHSRRTFSVRQLSPEQMLCVKQAAAELEKQSGLCFSLQEGADKLFVSFRYGKASLREAHYFFAICAEEDTPLQRGKAGYYGQQLALYMNSLNLGCCWETRRFQQKTLCDACALPLRTKIVAVLVFGLVTPSLTLREDIVHQTHKSRALSFEKLFRADRMEIPYWFHRAVEYFHKTPERATSHAELLRLRGNEIHITPVPEKEVSLGIGALHVELAVDSLPSCRCVWRREESGDGYYLQVQIGQPEE